MAVYNGIKYSYLMHYIAVEPDVTQLAISTNKNITDNIQVMLFFFIFDII